MRIRKIPPYLFVDGEKHKLNDIISVTKGTVYSLISLREPKAIEVTSRGFFGNKKTLLKCSGENEREELYQQIMDALK